MSPRTVTSKLTPSGITAQISLFILSLPITCRPFRPHCLHDGKGICCDQKPHGDMITDRKPSSAIGQLLSLAQAIRNRSEMSTIMEVARRGEITPMMKKIAEKENVSPEFIRNGIASGRICAPCNPAHDPEPAAIGEGLSVKINVNLGTSRDIVDLDAELQKLQVALKYGADAVMDLSTGGDIDAIRARLLKECPVMMGSVPIYQTGLTAARRNAVVEMTSQRRREPPVQELRLPPGDGQEVRVHTVPGGRVQTRMHR